ncbi:MAG: peptidoglycan DD-metalloendopeptidase family protein [Desulfovibrionaceae bacterium]|nr:peptidoglycan DD-metalloendopeptidase family protein [Desulfovibrionaceae bacterium]
MDSFPVDPSLALQEAARSDLVQRKLDMDALRKRLGDTTTKEQKLRESCEGFEAIFLQKMWEQMRKTVPKEGYLHSKDEETYQSMFDVELCKKMTSAGGIGLADMLYEQLSQQLENTGRTTRPGAYRQFMPIPPADGLLPSSPGAQSAMAKPALLQADADKKLTIEDLYTPLEQEPLDADPALLASASTITSALDELKAELGMTPKDAPGAAVRDWAAARDAATGLEPAPAMPVDTANPSSVRNAAGIDPSTVSWQGPGPVSAKPKSAPLFGRDKNAARTEQAEVRDKQPAQPKGMVPSETLWPLSGEQGAVTSRFGWEDDPASGKRRWNSGVWISAAPDAPVRAVLPGTVVYAGPREGRGYTVVLEHQDGYRSYYSNLEPNSLQIGEQIRHGAEFAKIMAQPSPTVNGENSASLHFELKKGEMALNPESAINRT